MTPRARPGRMRRTIALASLSVVVALAGCQGGKATALPFTRSAPAELRIGVAAVPSATDPATAQVYESGITRAVYEPLLRPRPGLAGVAPAAAERYEVAGDGLTYTFHLRAAARWDDGVPVVAADFRSAWRRVLDPRVNSPAGEILAGAVKGAAAYSDIDPVKNADRIPAFLDQLGIAVPDERTLVVTLAAPAPWFASAVTMPELSPVRLAPDGSLLRIGNGPFRLGRLAPDRVELDPARHYWAGVPSVQRVVLVPRGNSEQQLAAFQDGSSGIVALDAVAGEAFNKQGAGGRRLDPLAHLEVDWFQFNVHRAPFDNPLVRLAVAQSVDRNALVKQVLHGAARPSLGLAPIGLAGYRPDLAPQAFDASRARATLDSSGESPDQLTDVHLLVRDIPAERALAEAFAAQVREHVGIKLTLDVLPSTQVSARLGRGDFQVQGPAGWIGDYADPQDFFDQFLAGRVTGQWSRYANPAYDTLVTEADRSLDAARRPQVYAQAQQLLATDAPVVFLFQPVTAVAHQSWVGGLNLTGLDDWPGDNSPATLSAAAH